MRKCILLFAFCFAGYLCALPVAQGKIIIDLVYDFDATTDPYGFFDATEPNGQAARAALAYAAQTFSDRLLDSFTAIQSSGSNTFRATFVNPGTGATNYPSSTNAQQITSVPANTIEVVVGARSMGTQYTTLAQGSFGGFTIGSGASTDFINNAISRGQTGMLTSPRTDFATWGGSLAVNTDVDWFYGLTPAGLSGTTKIDFVSVATHELAHLLGFTIGPTDNRTSFYGKLSGNYFTGSHAETLYGGPVPVYAGDQSHWNDLTSKVNGISQKALMDPSISQGERRKMTDLDWAGFQDMGWQLARPGDADADGTVGFSDLVAVAQHYNFSGATTWSMGDFNYDGVVDFSDLVAVAQNYGATGALGAPAAASLPAGVGSGDFAADWARALEVAGNTPEPGTLVFVGLVMAVMGRRGRGRSSQR